MFLTRQRSKLRLSTKINMAAWSVIETWFEFGTVSKQWLVQKGSAIGLLVSVKLAKINLLQLSIFPCLELFVPFTKNGQIGKFTCSW